MLAFERTTNPDPVTLVPRPIPLSESIDPASPNFMRWYEPHPYQGMNERCREPQIVRGVQALRFVADYRLRRAPGLRHHRQPVDRGGLAELALGDHPPAPGR